MSDQPLSVLRDIEAPPGGWRLTVEQTGHTVTAPYFKQLKPKVLDHMIANSVPIPQDFEAWVQDAACRESGHGIPWCGGKPKQPVVTAGANILSLGTAKRFLRTMLHAIKDRKFVSREEALRRAAICHECPLPTSIGGCRGCAGVFKMAKKFFPNNPVRTEPDREFCSACGCSIEYKVWLPNDTLDKAETERPEYWSECWRNES